MQADEGAEVEVNSLVFVEKSAEQAAFLRRAVLVPVEVDANRAVIRLFGEADTGVALVEGDFAEIDAAAGRGRFGRGRRGVVGDVHAKVFGEWFQAAVVALRDEAEFPRAIAAVAFAEDERGFAAAAEVQRAGDECLPTGGDAQADAAEACGRLARGIGNGDAFNGGRLAREVNGEGAAAVVAAAAHAAVVALLLAVENHVAIAAHFAIGGEAVGSDVNIRAAVDMDGNVIGVKRCIAAGSERLCHGFFLNGNGE